MKISNSDLKKVLKNHEIDEDNQASIISQLETKEIIEENRNSNKESDNDDQAGTDDLKNKNSAQLAAELGYKAKDKAAG